MDAVDRKETNSQESCRACNDFKSWFKIQANRIKADKYDEEIFESKCNQTSSEETGEVYPKDCPPDKQQLGNASWSVLHTFAAYYPENPSPEDQNDMKSFINLFAKFFPCDYCSKDFQLFIQECPPETLSAKIFSKWLCDAHNQVNEKLGKPLFNCDLVFERWKDGWKDGSCD